MGWRLLLLLRILARRRRNRWRLLATERRRAAVVWLGGRCSLRGVLSIILCRRGRNRGVCRLLLAIGHHGVLLRRLAVGSVLIVLRLRRGLGVSSHRRRPAVVRRRVRRLLLLLLVWRGRLLQRRLLGSTGVVRLGARRTGRLCRGRATWVAYTSRDREGSLVLVLGLLRRCVLHGRSRNLADRRQWALGNIGRWRSRVPRRVGAHRTLGGRDTLLRLL